MKFNADEFIREITSPPKVDLVAEDSMSPTDEAYEHAKAHWWMGWTWEEISSTLEDMGYTQKVVNNALSRTQTYARDVLNDGPFSMYKEGQLVKLTNGFIGQISNIFRDHIDLVALEDQSIISVEENQVDKKASIKLREAYILRLGAYKIVKAGPEDDSPSDIQKLMPRPPVMPDPPQSQMRVRPDDLEKLDVKVTERAPKGWGEITPQFSEVEEVSNLAATVLQQIESAEKELVTVEGELKELTTMAKEYRSKQKELKKQEAELAKQLFSVVGSENAAINDLEITFFQKFKNKIVGLQRTIQEVPQEPGVMDELTALKEILTRNVPEISEDVFSILETWKQENTSIVERIHETFALYPPPKKKSGQIIETMTDWFRRSWEKIKDTVNGMYHSLFPKINSTSDQLDDIIQSMESKSRGSAIEAALHKLGVS